MSAPGRQRTWLCDDALSYHPSQEVADMLAQYAPDGGPQLYSEKDLAGPLERLASGL